MEEKKRKKEKDTLTIVLAIIAGILVLACAAVSAAYVVFKYSYNSSNHVKDEAVTLDYDYIEHAKADGVFDDADMETLSDDEIRELKAKFEEEKGIIEEVETAHTYGILLIGSDRRSDNWYGNSDAMILLTINDDTKKIYLVSFMRDLYADIPGIGVRKLNAAHANGGGPLLVQTLESNYGVSIDNYASVDFESMASIIDMIGGVDIEVSEQEAEVANREYVTDVCNRQGLDPASYFISGGGVCHLNGIQAVAYARIRYVGNADYERTSRQREVLMAMINKAKGLGVGTMVDVVRQMLPLVTHNLDESESLALIARIPDLINYEVVMDRVPYDGLFYSSNEMLIPDMAETISRLRATIYAVE